MNNNTIIILDFGSQYTQLIARRVREIGVFSVVLPCDVSIEKIQSMNPNGIILSGGPETVTQANTPKINKELFNFKIPLLGICYGMQTIAQELDGMVINSDKREFGHASIRKLEDSILFDNVNFSNDTLDVWMSHGDKVDQLPDNFSAIAESDNCAIAAFQNVEKSWFGLQFHPEVTHTDQGSKILSNFVYTICKCEKNWETSDIIESMVSSVKNQVNNDKVLLGLSGGVDSSVVAMLLDKCIKDNLICIFVDHGLLRSNEVEEVMTTFQNLGINIQLSEASDIFLDRLKGVTDPEEKRVIIGNTFIDVFEKEAKKIDDIQWLAQGTIYPDVIESSSDGHKSSVIKSHHNVGGLPERMNLKLVEPIRDLFKDEVKKIGKELNTPESVLKRHPFPGPGLGIRIIGEINTDRINILQKADNIYIEEIRNAGLYDKIWQAFAVLMPVKTVGVMGDHRSYEQVCGLRAVTSVDGMTADFYQFSGEFLSKVSTRIINEVKGINRVVYDTTSKPPGTIEWE